MTVPSYLPTYPIPQSPSSPRRLCFSFDKRDEVAKGAGRVSVTEAAREDDGKWWRPPATGDEASEQTLSTMLKLIPRDNACLSSFSLYLFLFLSHLTRYRVFLLSMLVYLSLSACIRLLCNELFYLNRWTLARRILVPHLVVFNPAFLQAVTTYGTSSSFVECWYQRSPLSSFTACIMDASLHAHLHTLPNH